MCCQLHEGVYKTPAPDLTSFLGREEIKPEYWEPGDTNLKIGITAYPTVIPAFLIIFACAWLSRLVNSCFPTAEMFLYP